MFYLTDFEEINGGYVAFGSNPKGGKITSKGKIKTGKLDFDDVYFVKELKFNLFSISQMYDKKNSVLFTDTECIVLSFDFKLPDENHVLLRATLDESNLWHRRLGHINFKTINKLVKDKAGEGNVQPYFHFLLWSSGSKDPQNTDADATFKVTEPEFEVKEPEFAVKEPKSEVHVSLSSSVKTKKHDDKTKREAKGKSPVKLSTRVRNLSEEFEDFSSNSTNEVNTASTPVPAVEPNSTNSTNTFSTVGPSNTAFSLNFDAGGKSSYVDPSQYLGDPYMQALEDITY
nr:hypothetical protein [Tanacetum cinerariifolium]